MSFVARCFPAEICKMGRYTTAVCCEVKIVLLEQNHGPNAAPNSFRGERGPTFFLFFLFLFPGCTSRMGSAVAVAPGADGIHLGGRALYPGGLLLVVLVGI